MLSGASPSNDTRAPLLGPPSPPPAPPDVPSPVQKPLDLLRTLVFATNVLNNISLGCTAPFLQHHLEVHYEQSYQSAGLVFAIFPLVALLCSPLGAFLCRAGRDKYLVWQSGLLVSLLAAIGFGLARSVPVFLLMRGLQGLGFALSTIAGLGLLIERTPDLTADIARQEVLVGVSMVVAPALGGFLYSLAGFAAVFVVLAVCFGVLAAGLGL
ncbi:vesicular acetylcholine transporter, partial [Nannochloropsis gaditana]